MKESIIYGLFGGLIGSLYMGWICFPKPLQSLHTCLAVVDMQALISKKSQQLAKTIMPETRMPGTQASPARVPPASVSIREAADHLKEDLNAFAATHNLILLAKGAVVAGDIPDKTEEILAMIEAGERP